MAARLLLLWSEHWTLRNLGEAYSVLTAKAL
jgi:hypothetical protein